MAKQPVCPRCGQKVKAGERHTVIEIDHSKKIDNVTVRHTTPCPTPPGWISPDTAPGDGLYRDR